MERLIQGVRQFVREVLPHRQAEIEKLADGQSPATLFITCSDSRIVPELITQTGPGDMFVIRNAGNIVPRYASGQGSEAAAVEYALSVLKVRQVVVCGHTRCGAITALRDPQSTEHLPAVREWIDKARAAKELFEQRRAEGEGDGEALIRLAVETNVREQLHNLLTHPSVAEGVAEGRVTLSGWVYELTSGRVLMHCTKRDAFVDLEQANPAPGVPAPSSNIADA